MNDAERAAYLCSAPAIRDRCTQLLAIAETTGLPHFTVHPERLPAAADFTAGVIRRNYPTLDIPHHARWRHFAAGGVDRWPALAALIDQAPEYQVPGYQVTGYQVRGEMTRRRVELCIVSVLLDAGAGPAWRYRDTTTGQLMTRSEGLGVASLDAFRHGLFALDRTPRADAEALLTLDPAALAHAFQVTPANPLLGLEGRATLLHRLGAAVQARPDLFPGQRLGALFDAMLASGTPIQAPAILARLLDGLGSIWPCRMTLAGRPLGDTWPHAAMPGDQLIPFHKLSQWLTYSLLEVFEDAGHPVVGIDDLTGLPEYRNGGLLIDCGVLQPNDPDLPAQTLTPGSEAVVEWRALTVALIDRLAPLVRARLGRDQASLPLSRILEGGTWAAGRAIAAQRRPGGTPPLTVQSDGTVF
jgi:hypothetical protein